MSIQVRLRLVCAGIGLAILPAFDLYIFLIDHWFPHLPKWPMFSVFLLCPPVMLANPLAADAGDAGVRDFYMMCVLAGFLNAGIYALVGPAFWRLCKNIREAVLS
jgi:hypothetical protein